MSILAGICARKPNTLIPERVRLRITSNLSRDARDFSRIDVFSSQATFLAKLDLGVFREAGRSRTDDPVCFIAGEPLLTSSEDPASRSRTDDADTLGRALLERNENALRACRGTYCGVAADRDGKRVSLVVDKVGVRPLYFWELEDFVVFASALRILEQLDLGRRMLDLQAVAEIGRFGFALADRTPYQNIKCLRAGEVVNIESGKIERSLYHRWDRVPLSSDGDVTERIYRTFRTGVRLRLANDTAVSAFLSGGLDSRAVVAALRSEQVAVYSVNLGAEGTQDHAFSQAASDELGTIHSHATYAPAWEGDRYSKAEVGRWLQSEAGGKGAVQRTGLIWSGDGGSVGLGHVYLTKRIVDVSRSATPDVVCEEFLRSNGYALGTGLLRRSIAHELESLGTSGIETEFASYHPLDKGRLCFQFLMLNDQRRHLENHFENLDLGRVEFQMPFYDASFLEQVYAAPIDEFLRHEFYMKWLSRFPQPLLGIPWQAYPGHVPCTLPSSNELRYQWGGNTEASVDPVATRNVSDMLDILVKDAAVRGRYLSTWRILAMRILLRLGRPAIGHQLTIPKLLVHYSSKLH